MSNLPARIVAPGSILAPQTYEQLIDFAERAAKSDMVPRDYKGKPANIVIAVQMGSELGLQPMQSLNSIAVINGRPGVWGDGLIGLCQQSPLCEDIREWFEGEGDAQTAFCEAKRRGRSPVVAQFSVADAKRARLWGKDGTWSLYPNRMLQNRARGFALRDAFPDLLRGLKTIEELQDYPEERAEPRHVRSTVTSQSRPQPADAAEPVGEQLWRIVSRDGTFKELPDEDAFISEWRMRIAAVEKAAKIDDAQKVETLRRMLAVNRDALDAIGDSGHLNITTKVTELIEYAIARHEAPSMEVAAE